MKEKRILSVLGDVDDRYIEEMIAQNEEEIKHHSVKRVWLVGAIIALMVFLLGCAVVLMSLDDLLLNEDIAVDPHATEVTEVRDILSLQGFVGSNNYQAAKEWYEFLQTYDPDGKILRSLSNEETMMPEEYWSYNCYTPEMTAKVDEICEKYGLNKQGMAKLFDSEENFYQTLKIESIILKDAEAEVVIDPNYYYKTGSFMLSGETTLTGENRPWIYAIEYQLYCVVKTDFDEVYLNVGNIESYDQWEYTTLDGTKLLLALSPDQALVIVDKADYFVTMNILNPRVGDILYGEQMMSPEALEAFADTFDFTFRPQPVSDRDWEAVQERPAPTDIAREERKDEAMKSIGAENYAGRVQDLLENAANPEQLGYTLLDIDGDGTEELLIGQDDVILYIYTVSADQTEHILTGLVARRIIPYGATDTAVMTNAASYMYLCEENAVAYVYEEVDGTLTHHFARPEGGALVWAEEIVHDPCDTNAPYQIFTAEPGSNRGYNDICTAISEEAYNKIMDSYVRVDLNLTPLDQYPLA